MNVWLQVSLGQSVEDLLEFTDVTWLDSNSVYFSKGEITRSELESLIPFMPEIDQTRTLTALGVTHFADTFKIVARF